MGHILVKFLMVWNSHDRDLFKFVCERRLFICVFPFPPAPVKLVGEIKQFSDVLLVFV